jgi:hypothetical protein
VSVVILGESLQLRLVGHGLPSLPPKGAALGVVHLAGGGHIPAAVHGFGQEDQQQPAAVGCAVQQGGVLATAGLVPRPAVDGLLDLLRRDAVPGDVSLGLRGPLDLPTTSAYPAVRQRGTNRGCTFAVGGNQLGEVVLIEAVAQAPRKLRARFGRAQVWWAPRCGKAAGQQLAWSASKR